MSFSDSDDDNVRQHSDIHIEEPANRSAGLSNSEQHDDIPFHPAADLFPLLEGEEFDALVEDVRIHGLLEPIWVYDGQIIDGRNRYRACKIAGIKAFTAPWMGTGTVEEFIASQNLHRRHLNPSQRASVAAKLLPRLREAARKRQGHRSDLKERIPEGVAGEARAKAAEIVGTNARYITDYEALSREEPELAREVESGKRSVPSAMREWRKRVAAREADSPVDLNELSAKFHTIVINPPKYNDDGQLLFAPGASIPMSFAQLALLPVSSVAAADCDLYLWCAGITLVEAFDLLERWNFRYVECLAACQPVAEGCAGGEATYVLFAVHGRPERRPSNLGRWFPAGMTSQEDTVVFDFFALVEDRSPAPYAEMPARNVRQGWTSWKVPSRSGKRESAKAKRAS